MSVADKQKFAVCYLGFFQHSKLIALSGKCSPEDVGGPPGHENFLEAIADPKHPEHKDIMEWYDSDFDPNTPTLMS
ncbi:MAG: hypothetical protein COA81_05750 [Alphaproteobacteria bacterium]|nr:MAG: hypothetical protein COA81_05750 [Alphaproteobacteria bacterium]